MMTWTARQDQRELQQLREHNKLLKEQVQELLTMNARTEVERQNQERRAIALQEKAGPLNKRVKQLLNKLKHKREAYAALNTSFREVIRQRNRYYDYLQTRDTRVSRGEIAPAARVVPPPPEQLDI